MAKAINWPLGLRAEILAEDSEGERCAFRLGTLYYDHHYWVAGEVVDIRVNHLKVRKAEIIGELKCCPIRDLTEADFSKQSPGLRTVEAVVEFLTKTYDQPVTDETLITVVYYQNRPVIPEEMELPEDARPVS